MKQKSLFIALGAGVLAMLLLAALAFSAAPDLFSSAPEDSGIAAENVTGDVSIRRSGNNYTLKNGLALYPGDEIIMGRTAACEIVAESRARITLDRDSRVAVREQTDERFSLEVIEGAVFFDLIRSTPESSVAIRTAYSVLYPDTGAIFSVEAYTGTQTVNLYAGSARLTYEGRTRRLAVGDHVSMIQTDEENTDTTTVILASELRAFLLEELIARNGLCFGTEALRKIIADRAADTLSIAGTQPAEHMTCTVEIRCDTVLTHTSQRKESPSDVPSDGVILPPTPVKFT